MSWFQTLQVQPWFTDVAQEFANLAPDVPAPLWEGELLTEDSSLNPKQQDYLSSGHWGLFQENVNFPTTVGLPAATVDQLQTPTFNAGVAALAMEKAIKASGATTIQGQVEALEKAGWPGAISPSETQTRVANVNQLLAAQGGNVAAANAAPQGYPWWDLRWMNPFDPKAYAGANPAISNAVNGVPQAITAGIQTLGQNLLVGGVIIAGITGGFLLLGNSMNDGKSGGAPMPVPVPI